MRRLAIAMSLLFPVLSHGQGLSTRLSQVDTAAYPTLGVVLTVFSEAGKPVSGLTKDDFSLDEDGAKVALVSVEIERAPLAVSLVLDLSGSMRPALGALKQAVGDFLRNLDPKDRVELITFSDRPNVKVELTMDRRRVMDAVEALDVSGATALFDAAYRGIEELRGQPGRRMVVLFTDGKDQNKDGTAPQSMYTAKAVAQLARDQQVSLWTIGLGPDVDAALLNKLAEVTGGHGYRPAQAGQLRAAFGRVLTVVRMQYRLTYRTPKEKRDGTERTVTVTSTAKGRSGQGRSRYLAPAETVVAEVIGKPARPRQGAGAVLEPGTEAIAAVQVGKMVFKGWNSHSHAEVFKGTGAEGEKPVAKTSYFFANDQVALPSGKYVVHIVDHPMSNVSGSFSIDVKAGQTLIVPGPDYRPASAAPPPPEPAEPPPQVETVPAAEQ